MMGAFFRRRARDERCSFAGDGLDCTRSIIITPVLTLEGDCSSHECDANAQCQEVLSGGYTCSCRPG